MHCGSGSPLCIPLFLWSKITEDISGKKVLVRKSDKPLRFIPPPAITICPSNIEYAFPIFSIKERHKMRENWDSVFEYLCGLVI